VKPNEIVAANEMQAGAGVDVGDELVIPVASATSGVHPQRYTVRRGDTLVTVADRFDVSVDELRRWNHLSSNTVPAGRSLHVAEPVKLAPTTHVHAKHARSGGKGSESKGSGAKKSGSGSSEKGAASKKATSTKKTITK
jgi:membrane-bound lytic murein transglycosylase D